MYTTIPGSRVPANSSNVGSPDGFDPDLDTMGGRCSTLEDKVNEIFLRLAQLLALAQSVSKFSSHVQTLTNAVGVLTTRIARNRAKRQHPRGPYLRFGSCKWVRFRRLWIPSMILALAWGSWWFSRARDQVQRTTTGICDENSKQTPMMKTRTAPFSCVSHARKVVQRTKS